MSGYLAGRVWRSALPGRLKPLTACLADFANDDGSGVHPSVEYLMWMLDIAESTVRAGMSELRKLGVLIPVENENGGRGKFPVYELCEDKLPRRPGFRDFKKGPDSGGFSGKGPDSDTKRVQITDQKGPENGMRNKEEPSVEPSVEPSEQTTSLFGHQHPTPLSPEQKFGTLLLKVWGYYIDKFGKNAKVYTLTDKRQAMFKARWAEALVKTSKDWDKATQLMEIAIDQLAESDFHNARGRYQNGTRYNDWENIFRSADLFEKWLDKSNG